MVVSNPRECTERAHSNREVRGNTDSENSVVADIAMSEGVNDLEDEPENTGQCASTVNSSQVLEDGCATKPPPERRPL